MPLRDQFRLASHGRRFTRQVDLGPLAGQHELLPIGRVEDVEAGLLLEAVGDDLGQGGIDIVTTELADALRRNLLEDTVVDAQDRHVEGAAAEVVDEDRLILLGVQAVADGRRRRLVDQRQHLHAGRSGTELRGVTGQALAVGRDRHHRLHEGIAQNLLGVLLEQRKEHDGDLLGTQVLAHQRHPLGGAENALDRTDGALLVEVLLGLLTEGQAAVPAQGDDRGRVFLALVIGNDLGLAKLEVRHHRVTGAEVDTDVRGHGKILAARAGQVPSRKARSGRPALF